MPVGRSHFDARAHTRRMTVAWATQKTRSLDKLLKVTLRFTASEDGKVASDDRINLVDPLALPPLPGSKRGLS